MKIIVKDDVIESELVEFVEGSEQIKLRVDGNKIIVCANPLNTTNVKVGDFTISGEVLEIEAGIGIRLSTAMPNKLKISAEFDKYTSDMFNVKERMEALEKRMEVIEKAFSSILKQLKK